MKNLIISFDDIYKGNDKIEEFKKLKEEIPDFKVTFFVIAKDDIAYWESLKEDWIELVFHSTEHSGGWLKWSKEETIEKLKYYSSLGFSNGFKAPGWKMTQNIADAINELNFWGCVCKGHEFGIKNKWITRNQGLDINENYIEMYGHIQDIDFKQKIDSIKKVVKNNEIRFKFISEVLNEYENI